MSSDEKRDRLIEAAAVLLDASDRHRLNTVSLNKGLFYLDLACLRDFGQTFTSTTYIALPRGPVVARYDKRLIAPLVAEGIAEQRQIGLAFPVLLMRLPQFRWMTSSVKELAGKVAPWCSKHTSRRLSDVSHKNPGWLIACEEEVNAGGRKQAINMYIAMQQIVDDDPWMDEPLGQATLTACKAADAVEGDRW